MPIWRAFIQSEDRLMSIEPNDLEAWKRIADAPNGDAVYRLAFGRERLKVITGDNPPYPTVPMVVSISRSWHGRVAWPTADEISMVKASFDLTGWAVLGRTRHVVYLVPGDASDEGKAILRAGLDVVRAAGTNHYQESD